MGKDFTYTGSGTNSQVGFSHHSICAGHVLTMLRVPQGNHWCSRDYGNSGNGYHYSNKYVFSFVVINPVAETRPTK